MPRPLPRAHSAGPGGAAVAPLHCRPPRLPDVAPDVLGRRGLRSRAAGVPPGHLMHAGSGTRVCGMADWDGTGLPPAAAARMARFQADGVRTSLLDVPGAASVTGVGLPPVGEVMGCMVEHIGWAGFGGCGYWGPGAGWGLGTVTSGSGARYAG